MRLNSKWNRRGFLGSLGMIASAIMAPHKLFSLNRSSAGVGAGAGASTPIKGLGETGNPFEELGVTTVINGEGTMTVLGGSLPHPELEAVMF
ncbi:MAG: L-seryl-tRNA selenium transferase, partial [Terriglobales bacterium]